MKYCCFILLATLLFLKCKESTAQQCTGYVLYQEDFSGDGSSPAIGNPLPEDVTSYSYTTRTPVEDGEYGIRKSVTGHQDTWHQATDHTGKGGYMMLINASYAPGLFYQTRIENLCQGSTFYFSAWVANLMRSGASGPLDPNLRFEIRKASDSSLIGEYTTGLLPRYSTFTWEEYGIHFSLPAGESSVILQIFNNQGGGNGNDLVLDDITFSLCGPPIKITQIGMYENTHDACTGDAISFEGSIAPDFYQTPGYQWQFSTDSTSWQDIPGANTPNYEIPSAGESDSGWYRLLVAEKENIDAPHCRIASHAVPLQVWSPQPLTLHSNSPACEGESLEITAPPGLKYQWLGPGGYTAAQQSLKFDPVTPAQQGTYTLTLTTRGGCVSKAHKNVKVQENDLSVSLGFDSLLCEGHTIHLNANNAGASYQWNTGEQTPSILVQKGGFYKVTVSKGICTKTDSLFVREILTPVVNLGSDTIICIGEPFILNAAFADAENYRWQDGSVDATYKVIQPGNYQVIVSNRCGTAQDDIAIAMETCADHLLFPTAFTPNHDGQNDLFHPKVLLGITSYELKIFDRWGRRIFVSKNPSQGWDGTYEDLQLPMGSYIWMAHYRREKDNSPVFQKGTIMLIR